jgi:hypothetical protein
MVRGFNALVVAIAVASSGLLLGSPAHAPTCPC